MDLCGICSLATRGPRICMKETVYLGLDFPLGLHREHHQEPLHHQEPPHHQKPPHHQEPHLKETRIVLIIV